MVDGVTLVSHSQPLRLNAFWMASAGHAAGTLENEIEVASIKNKLIF